MTQQHTPGPFKIWHSGYAEASAIIYTGDIPPRLGKSGKLMMAPGSYIAEVSTQRGHMMPNEDYIQHDNASLFAAAPETAAERDQLKVDYLATKAAWAKADSLNAELVKTISDFILDHKNGLGPVIERLEVALAKVKS